MRTEDRDLSLAIDRVVRPLAAWTVEAHSDIDSTLAERYGEGWRALWLGDVENRLQHLAQAVAVRRHEVFDLTVTWSAETFAERGLPAADLTTSVACMREVIAAELPNPGSDLANEIVDSGLDTLRSPTRITGAPTPKNVALFRDALLAGRRAAAESVLSAALDEGWTPSRVHHEIIAPALHEIGRLWQTGAINVGDEHAASAMAETLIARMAPDATPDRDQPRIVVTAAPSELHSIGARMVADIMLADGWDVTYLGANMPIADLVTLVAARCPQVVAVAATSFLRIRGVAEVADALRADSSAGILVGGAMFDAVDGLWRDVGADAVATSPAGAVTAARGLLGRSGDAL